MSIYIALIALITILHLIPLGGSSVALNKMEFGQFRADYLLHSLLFLPWMVLPVLDMKLKTQRNSQISNEARISRNSILFLTKNEERSTTNQQLITDNRVWFLLGLVFATGLEGIQYWLPYRGFNPMDMLFNVLGVILGGAVLVGFRMIAPRFATTNE